MNPVANQSGGGKVQFKIILILSDAPTAAPQQVEYLDNLKQAIKSVLNIAMEWNIELTIDDPPVPPKADQTSRFIVSVVFASLSANLGDVLALQSKLDSPAFFDQLNSLGFKASKPGSESPFTSTTTQASSPLVVGLCSAAGVLTGLICLICMAHHYVASGRDKNGLDSFGSGIFLEDSFTKSSLEIPGEKFDNDSGDHAAADSDCNNDCIVTGIDQVNETDYSKEFEDILQLLARLAINIKSLFDPLSRKDIEASVENTSVISTQDHAALLQLISKIDLDDKSLVYTPDRTRLLQQRVREGPLTENHFLVMKLLSDSEIHAKTVATNEDMQENIAQEMAPSTSVSEISEQQALEPCDSPLRDVMLLLKHYDLEPSYLTQNESRKLIEDNLANRQDPLLPAHMAVLQLISRAEIDSDLSMDPMRKRLLERQIEQGPLNACHLDAAQSLL